MEKKSEPTPELKEKLAELKSKVESQKTRELSADELNAVAGGDGSSAAEGSCFVRNGVAYIVGCGGWGEMTVDEFYDIVKWAYDSYDVHVAIGVANEIFPSLHNETTLLAGGPEYFRDMLRSRIFSVAENGVAYGSWL